MSAALIFYGTVSLLIVVVTLFVTAGDGFANVSDVHAGFGLAVLWPLVLVFEVVLGVRHIVRNAVVLWRTE